MGCQTAYLIQSIRLVTQHNAEHNIITAQYFYLVIRIHLVLESPVVTAFSNSSRPPVFLSFLTKLLTAFSDHLSSFSLSPFLQAKSRLTIGGVNGENCVILARTWCSRQKKTFLCLSMWFLQCCILQIMPSFDNKWIFSAVNRHYMWPNNIWSNLYLPFPVNRPSAALDANEQNWKFRWSIEIVIYVCITKSYTSVQIVILDMGKTPDFLKQIAYPYAKRTFYHLSAREPKM